MSSPPGLTELQSLLFNRQLATDPRGPIVANTQRYGPIWQSRCEAGRALVPLTWLMGPAGNERVLGPKYREDFSASEHYNLTREPPSGGDIRELLDAEPAPDAPEAALHRERQRRLAPSFQPRLTSRDLAALVPLIGHHLSDLAVNQPIDLARELKRLSLSILAQLLVGAAERELPRLHQLSERLGAGLATRLRLPIPGTKFYRARRARAELAAYVHDKVTGYQRGLLPPPPLLGQLMRETSAAELLPTATLVAEVRELLLAGDDTTASLITSALVALGSSPEVFRRLRDELRTPLRTLAPDADDPHLGEAELPYFEAVLLELERLYPPLLFATRSVRRSFEFGGYTIERGQKVAYSAYYTGRMAELFDDPLTFAPERFLAEEGAGVQRPPAYSLLGYGGGHHYWFGKRFASLQLRLLLGGLLQRFDIEFLEQESDVIFFSPTLQRKNGYWVRLYPRHLSVPTMAQL